MRSNKKGFTLIELAIVLVILGFTIASGTSLLALAVKRKATDVDYARLGSAKNSLFSYSAVHGVIPEKEGFASSVPYFLDFGGRNVAYIYDEGLTGVSGVDDAVCRRKTTSLILYQCKNYGCSSYSIVQNVAFVTIGGGANANIQTGKDSSGVVRIYLKGDMVDSYDADGVRIEEYDDITEWVTLGELQARSNCENYRLRILNNELPYAIIGDPYRGVVFADGGIPVENDKKYKWCLSQKTKFDALEFISGGTSLKISENCLEEAESNWTRGDNVTITGEPYVGTSGSYQLDFWVRDGNDPISGDDSIASKKLVLTIIK